MRGWVNSHIFEGQFLAQMIVKDAQSKSVEYVEMSYDAMVKEIAKWLRSWLCPEVPRPSELMALLTDSFLVVMKAKRKKLTLENFMDFLEDLEADVLKVVAQDYVKKGKGVKTKYKI